MRSSVSQHFAQEDHIIIILILLVEQLKAQRAKQLPHGHPGGLRAGPSRPSLWLLAPGDAGALTMNRSQEMRNLLC